LLEYRDFEILNILEVLVPRSSTYRHYSTSYQYQLPELEALPTEAWNRVIKWQIAPATENSKET